MTAGSLPRLPLGHWPTPLDPAPALAARLGLGTLHIKREDLAGMAMGGNKLRQIELILGAAQAAGADTLVTTASSQSNFCRAIAGACAASGMGCHLLLRRAGGQVPGGNLLLDHLFGAAIHWTDATDPWDPMIAAELDALCGRLRMEGARPLPVQLPGATAGLAAAAWAMGAAELLTAGTEPDMVVVACGSGLTAAGLALGLKRAGSRTRVLAVSVQQPVARLLPWMIEAASRAAALLGPGPVIDAADLTVTDDQVAPGYGLPSPASITAVRLAGRTQGMVLDPVYTGKAMAGLVAGCAAGSVQPGSRVVFLHSGGAPSLFLHAGAFVG